jgi:hypothetical protein
MSRLHQTPGLPIALPLDIPNTWNPEQALAVFQLVDDLREKIWSIYGLDIQSELQNQLRHPLRE